MAQASPHELREFRASFAPLRNPDLSTICASFARKHSKASCRSKRLFFRSDFPRSTQGKTLKESDIEVEERLLAMVCQVMVF